MKFGGRFFPWFSFVAYTALVIWSSVQTGDRVHPFVARHDKILHGLEYALLFALTVPAFRHVRILRPAAGTAFLYTLAVGLLTELLQVHVPGRSVSMEDWLADLAGASFTLAIYFMLKTRAPEGVFHG